MKIPLPRVSLSPFSSVRNSRMNWGGPRGETHNRLNIPSMFNMIYVEPPTDCLIRIRAISLNLDLKDGRFIKAAYESGYLRGGSVSSYFCNEGLFRKATRKYPTQKKNQPCSMGWVHEPLKADNARYGMTILFKGEKTMR